MSDVLGFLKNHFNPELPLTSMTSFPPYQLQGFRAPVDGHGGSAAWDGEGDAAAHEGNDAAGTWTAPLPTSRAKWSCYCGLSGGNAWQPTGNAANGEIWMTLQTALSCDINSSEHEFMVKRNWNPLIWTEWIACWWSKTMGGFFVFLFSLL